MIRALSRELNEWDTDHLVVLSTMEVAIDEVRSQVIYGMREQGITDTQIAQALGVTQQAVSKRWPGGGKYQGAAGRYRRH
jgi:DNA-directed RNA polymerase specialized sigma subunit